MEKSGDNKLPQIVFASGNPHKVAEIAHALEGRYEVLSLKDIGCEEEIPETGTTLEANARIKAQYVVENYGKDCFADDTGLEVNALNGEPGVYSARYAGPEKSSDKNMAKLLGELEGKRDRSARFRTVICLIQDGKEQLFEGIAPGEIITEGIGDEGFGYDPIFKADGYDRTFAQMDKETKNEISHRGKAVKALLKHLQEE